MRAMFFVIAVLIVCSALLRTIYLRSATVVLGYDVRKLRDTAADVRTDNDMLRAQIAKLSTLRAVEPIAKKMKLGLTPMACTVTTVRRIEVPRQERD